MVQLAWVQVSVDANQIGGTESRIVCPDGFCIPLPLSRSIASLPGRQCGRALFLGDVLEVFLGAMSAADTLVAHSVNFDRSVVGAEVVRQRGDDALGQTCVPRQSASWN
jgi:hypothetical protein